MKEEVKRKGNSSPLALILEKIPDEMWGVLIIRGNDYELLDYWDKEDMAFEVARKIANDPEKKDDKWIYVANNKARLRYVASDKELKGGGNEDEKS